MLQSIGRLGISAGSKCARWALCHYCTRGAWLAVVGVLCFGRRAGTVELLARLSICSKSQSYVKCGVRHYTALCGARWGHGSAIALFRNRFLALQRQGRIGSTGHLMCSANRTAPTLLPHMTSTLTIPPTPAPCSRASSTALPRATLPPAPASAGAPRAAAPPACPAHAAAT